METKSFLEDEKIQEAVRKKEKKQEDAKTLEYGTKQAVIEEIYLTDDNGTKSNAIIKGMNFGIHMRVRFQDDIPAPIFAFTVKNVKGTEITGTNTMFEKAFLEPVKAGAVKEITFKQRMTLQGGDYLLSFGVTGYDGNDFQVYHRLYDALDVTVISDKNTVGFYDMESAITVADAQEADNIIQYKKA